MSMDIDVIVVGSGINGLVCAALAARRGMRVCVLERNADFGGCIRSDALTLPGYIHDTLSGFHPLFVTSPGYRSLARDLADAGLVYVNTTQPTGVVTASGAHAILSTSREENVRGFDALCQGDGASFSQEMRAMEDAAALIFGLLGGEILSTATGRLLAKEAWRRGARELLRFCGESLRTSRQWLDSSFQGASLKALLAPWVLHTGVGPDAALSGLMNRLIAFTLETAGMPVVAGGSARLVAAFKQVIERNRGILLSSSHVERIVVERGRATGVQLRSGERMRARHAVVCSVTPGQLYLELLESRWVPLNLQQAARRYRYGRADMQIHLALAEPPRWKAAGLAGVAMVHITDGIDSVARAVAEADRGMLPERPTVVVGQPSTLDPTRAPAGAAVLWLQLQELPAQVRGDAAGIIAVPEGGVWSSKLKESYADRILSRLRDHIDNLDSAVLARTVLSPADLEGLNINLVGGDPYAGDCSLDQSFLMRPLAGTVRHETPVKSLYHIGASTHPGPGLGGVSGSLVAMAL